jgi:hypothetical protein
LFYNAFHYHESCKKAEAECDGSDDDDDRDNDHCDEEQNNVGFKDDEIVDDLEKSFISGHCLDQERIIEAAGCHIKQVKGMRGYVQQRTAAGIECRTKEVPHQDHE